MEKKIEEIAKKFEFVLNLCDKFPDDMDLRHVVKTLKNDVTEILKEQTANPSPSSLPTDEEIKEHAKEWASTAHSKDSDRASTILESTEYENRRYNYYKGIKLGLSLRTNFSSEKDGSEDLALKFGHWLDLNYTIILDGEDSIEDVYQIFKNRNTNPPKQEQQTTK